MIVVPYEQSFCYDISIRDKKRKRAAWISAPSELSAIEAVAKWIKDNNISAEDIAYIYESALQVHFDNEYTPVVDDSKEYFLEFFGDRFIIENIQEGNEAEQKIDNAYRKKDIALDHYIVLNRNYMYYTQKDYLQVKFLGCTCDIQIIENK